MIKSKFANDCTVCAFANAMGLSYPEAYLILSNYSKTLPECYDQEMVLAAISLGYALVRFDSNLMGERGLIIYTEEQLRVFLESNQAILIVKNEKGRHAVYWNGKEVLDSGIKDIKSLQDYQIEIAYIKYNIQMSV